MARIKRDLRRSNSGTPRRVWTRRARDARLPRPSACKRPDTCPSRITFRLTLIVLGFLTCGVIATRPAWHAITSALNAAQSALCGTNASVVGAAVPAELTQDTGSCGTFRRDATRYTKEPGRPKIAAITRQFIRILGSRMCIVSDSCIHLARNSTSHNLAMMHKLRTKYMYPRHCTQFHFGHSTPWNMQSHHMKAAPICSCIGCEHYIRRRLRDKCSHRIPRILSRLCSKRHRPPNTLVRCNLMWAHQGAMPIPKWL